MNCVNEVEEFVPVQWDESMIQAWKNTRPFVVNQLQPVGLLAEVDDVMSEIFLATHQSLDRFDASRGSFGPWIMGIAKKQVLKRRDKALRIRTVESAQLVFDDGSENPSMMGDVAEGVDSSVVHSLDCTERLFTIMTLLQRAMFDKPHLLERSLVLLDECHEDVGLASARLGITAAALRDSHRQVEDMAQVIRASLDLFEARRAAGRLGEALTVREILGCFPEAATDRRAWLRVIPKAVLLAGGWRVDLDVLAARVAESTGFSVVYARHKILRCERLYSVARTIAETGTLDVE